MDWKAVSQFTLAYVETMPSQAHHPTWSWIGIPEGLRLLCHTSPSCWVWLTATVWSMLMNCNRPFHYSIMPSQRAPWTTNFIYILYPWENFCQRFSKSKKNFNTQRHCGRYFFCHSKHWTGLICCAYIYFLSVKSFETSITLIFRHQYCLYEFFIGVWN